MNDYWIHKQDEGVVKVSAPDIARAIQSACELFSLDVTEIRAVTPAGMIYRMAG